MSENAVGALLVMSHVSVPVTETCMLTLSNLSCIEEMYSRIEDVNVAVLQLANLEMSPRMERMLVGCLCNLSCPKNNQGRLVEEGCVRVIARIIDARRRRRPSPRAARSTRCGCAPRR